MIDGRAFAIDHARAENVDPSAEIDRARGEIDRARDEIDRALGANVLPRVPIDRAPRPNIGRSGVNVDRPAKNVDRRGEQL